MSEGKRLDVVLPDDVHARLTREAERRGQTLAGYARSVLAGQAQAADAGDRLVAEIDRRLRALVPVLAAVAAWVREAGIAERDELTQLALEMFEHERGGQQ